MLGPNPQDHFPESSSNCCSIQNPRQYANNSNKQNKQIKRQAQYIPLPLKNQPQKWSIKGEHFNGATKECTKAHHFTKERAVCNNRVRKRTSSVDIHFFLFKAELLKACRDAVRGGGGRGPGEGGG